MLSIRLKSKFHRNHSFCLGELQVYTLGLLRYLGSNMHSIVTCSIGANTEKRHLSWVETIHRFLGTVDGSAAVFPMDYTIYIYNAGLGECHEKKKSIRFYSVTKLDTDIKVK